MIVWEKFYNIRVRSSFLFGLGAHLGIAGVLILAIYYTVGAIAVQEARDLLSWVVPMAQGCCFLAAVSLVAGWSARDSGASGRGWVIQNVLRAGDTGRSIDHAVGPEPRIPSVSEVDRVVGLLKGLDWKVFRDLGIAYFGDVGFRVVDSPGRFKGVDFFMYAKNDYNALAVRCLPRGTEKVDLNLVRSFQRSMLLAGAGDGLMFTTGGFDEDAIAFGNENSVELLSGEDFVTRLLSLPEESSEKLLQEAAGAEKIREEGKPAERKRRKKVVVEEKRWKWF